MFDDKTQQINRLLSIGDITLCCLCYLSAFWLQNTFITDDPSGFFEHIALFPLILALLLACLPYFDAYAPMRTVSAFSIVLAIGKTIGTTLAILLATLFFFRIHYVSRAVVFLFSLLAILSLSGLRLLLLHYFKRNIRDGRNSLKVLIIGTGERAQALTTSLREKADWGIDIIGHLDPDPCPPNNHHPTIKVIGTVHDISRILKDNVVDEVILAIPRTLLEDVQEIAYACQEEGIKLRLMADIFSLKISRMSLVELGSIPLLTLEPVAQDETKLLAKRFLDLCLVAFFLPILLPVLAAIAIAIKLDSPGPVFFVQQRVGLRKRLFPMFKFRSMVVDAESRMKEVEHLNEAAGPIFKITDDPRVTRVGKFLRKTSLDELPQLINVVRGEMSLVGPRPMSLRDVDLFDKGIQRKRFSVKPGLTCLWQISGRSNLPFEKWLELDLQYIENWSLATDFLILFKTIPAVLRGTGAV